MIAGRSGVRVDRKAQTSQKPRQALIVLPGFRSDQPVAPARASPGCDEHVVDRVDRSEHGATFGTNRGHNNRGFQCPCPGGRPADTGPYISSRATLTRRAAPLRRVDLRLTPPVTEPYTSRLATLTRLAGHPYTSFDLALHHWSGKGPWRTSRGSLTASRGGVMRLPLQGPTLRGANCPRWTRCLTESTTGPDTSGASPYTLNCPLHIPYTWPLAVGSVRA